MHRLQIATFDATVSYANRGTVLDFDIGSSDMPSYAYSLHPAKAVLQTPELVCPSNATGRTISFDLSFVGTIRFSRMTLRRKRG